MSPVAWNLSFPWLCSVYSRKEPGLGRWARLEKGCLNSGGEGNRLTAHKVLPEVRIQIGGLIYQNSAHLMDVQSWPSTPQLHSPTQEKTECEVRPDFFFPAAFEKFAVSEKLKD